MTQDRTTNYAKAVCDGTILAGPHVRDACHRHLVDIERHGTTRLSARDLDDAISIIIENPTSLGYYFDAEAAARGIRWFEKKLKLQGKPFLLFEWQAFVVGTLHGWKRQADGTRRFRYVYLETAKGSGKTPLAAGLALFYVFADNEPSAEGYIAAATMDQAVVTFRHVVDLRNNTQWLRERTRELGGAQPYMLIRSRANSFLRRIASTDSGSGRSGYLPQLTIIDEYHEHASAAMHDMLLAGFKSRAQGLQLVTTNAGTSLGSPCGLEHLNAVRVARLDHEDEQYFSYVCAMDEDDDLEDEALWIKTNPSLPRLPGYDYIRNALNRTKGIPSKRAGIERLQFCIWSDAESPWIDAKALDACRVTSLERELTLVGALDLSTKTDLCAASATWSDGDWFETEAKMWTPEDTMDARAETDAAPYRQWADEGYLTPIPGSVIDYEPIAEWLRQMMEKGMQHVAYDPHQIAHLIRELDKLQIKAKKAEPGKMTPFKAAPKDTLLLHPHPQGPLATGVTGLNMTNSISVTEELILKPGRLKILLNPALRSNILGAVVRPSEIGRTFSKMKSMTRIDACLTTVMSIGMAVALQTQDVGELLRQLRVTDAGKSA